VVSGKTPGMAIGEVSLFDVSGRCVGNASRRAKGSSPLSFDISKLARGTLRCEGEGGVAAQTMKICH